MVDLVNLKKQGQQLKFKKPGYYGLFK